MNEEITILQLDPTTFEVQDYKTSDVELIAVSDLDTEFSSSTDYIEFYIYDENQTKIYPSSTIPLTSFNVKQGDVLLNPQLDLENLGYDIGIYSIVYNFYRKRLSSNINETYFISEVSSDRTEIRLDSNTITNTSIVSSTNEFIGYRDNTPYFADFYLNFGDNKIVIANNISLDNNNTEDPTVLIKLYEPLPEEFDLKSQLWVVEILSTPQAYQVDFPFTPTIEDDFEFIAGPNFNLNVKQETGNSSQLFSYSELLNSNVTSSVNQIKNLLNTKEININVNYEDFNDFTHFSSVLTRLENFYYKVGLIENYSNQLNTISSNITSATTSSVSYISSVGLLNSNIDTLIQNFDGFEYFMYFNSGSSYSYPKSNSTPPFILYPTENLEVLTWLGSADESNVNYGGLALSASLFDEENPDRLYNSIPEYLKEDSENIKYELFIDMVAQHYDNIWLYTKDITNKFNADNRLDYGISKDLIADAIKDFGVKLYSNNFNNDDLYSAFLGITPSGSLFPFPEITSSLPTPSGYEYVDTQISASNDIVPLSDVNKRIYKRIYHNLPYLLKTKGTVAGLRALITSYGIPDTILRVNEFGGKDRNESQDWDLKQNVFNYAFNTGETSDNFLSSSLLSNVNFGGGTPQTIQLRFKTPGIPPAINNVASTDIRYSQSLWSTDDGGNLILEYTGSGLVSSSYSGSSIDQYDTWGTLKWIPAYASDPTISSSIYFPAFNQDWWSVQVTMGDTNTNSTLYVANEINGRVGFNMSDYISGYDSSHYSQSTVGFLNKDTNVILGSNVYQPFSGSFQELRYFNAAIPQNTFHDFVLNPYSIEGTTTNSTPNELFFRADLGTELNTESRTSIHPKVTGSLSQITQSFSSNSSFYINNAEWVSNIENTYQDQVPVGIKNRVTDKIALIGNDIAESPSGSNGDIKVLSPFQSVQQESFVSSSYTPDVNYLEVAFSPQDQINDDINAQLGYFNIGDYIGDPRHISSNERSYPALDTLRNAYFEKYINSYNVVDFIRLIKFFDNSLFKMIKDFTPARTSLSSGVVVKQHILERNKQRPAQVSWSNETYSGSIKPQSRNYSTGSGDVGQYEANGGSSIYKFTGGTGGSLERYNGLQTSPSASAYGLNNQFNLTQSYSETIEGSISNTINNSGEFVGYGNVEIHDQRELYNGEFSGSSLIVTDQILNPGCGPYLKVTDNSISFNPIVFSLTSGDGTYFQGTTTETEILLNKNSPKSGDAWIISEQISISPPIAKVKYIKLSNKDINNKSIGDFLINSNSIKWITPDAVVRSNNNVAEYVIEGVTEFANSTLLRISQTQGDNIKTSTTDLTTDIVTEFYPITSSTSAGSENWSLNVSGDYRTSDSIGVGNDNLQQGNFIRSDNYQKQYFWSWDNPGNDSQSFFNSGSDLTPQNNITSDISKFNFGSYNPKRTSNIPWFFSASISYSASSLGTGGVIISENNIYHSSSKYTGATLTDQNFTFSNFGVESGVFKPSPLTVDVSNTFFKSEYNNQIPGDSGSSVNQIGGHPKIKIAGTASIDFHFPRLKIGGTPRILSPAIPGWTPLSGSDLTTMSSTPNANFTSSFPEDTIVNWSSSVSPNNKQGVYQDGAIEVSYDGVEEYFLGDNPNEGGLNDIYIKYNLNISASISNYTASIQTRAYGSTNNTQNWYTLPQIYQSNANKQIVISNGEIPEPPTFSGITYNHMAFRIVLKSPEPSFEYRISTFNGSVYARFSGNNSYLSIPNTFNSTTFQGTPSNPQRFTSSFSSPGGRHPEIKIQAHLKKINSTGTVSTIASSDTPILEPIFGGKEFIFPDSPTINIVDINSIDDMYFIEYSMSNYDYNSDTNNESFNVAFLETGDLESKILITQALTSSEDGAYNLTGSLLIEKGNYDNPTQMGDVILSQQFIVPNSSSSGNVTLTGSFEFPFEYDDVFRMAVEVIKPTFNSGLAITSYTMSISPSSSIYAPLSSPPTNNIYKIPTSSGFIIPSYFGEGILPFNLALDCQPTLNNYNDIRDNSFIMDVSYNNISGSISPVNFDQILNNTADKAQTPDSNYTSTRSIRPRYNGTKTTGNQYNIWSIKDVDTYGKNPVIELKDAYFGYFKNIKDLYPLVNDKISLELTYLLDQQSNAVPPSLEGYGVNILEKTFPISNPISIGFISSSQYAQELDDSYPIYKLASKPTPILYSQTSSAGYALEIPLTGSGRISMYDNNDINTIVDYSFTAQGTSSYDNNNIIYTSKTSNYTQIINPTEEVVIDPFNAGSNYIDPYTTVNGSIIFGDNGSESVDKNPQRISMQTSFATSFLNESGGVELAFDVQMVSGSTPVEFNLEDISLIVHRTGKEPFNAGSIIGSGINNLIRFVSPISTTFTRKRNLYKTDTINAYNPQRGSYYALIENVPLNSFLTQKGVYTQGKGGAFFKGDINGLEFVIKANSGEFLFKTNDSIHFKVKIEIQKPKKEKFGPNILYPADYEGLKFPSKLSTIGERTSLLAGDNKGTSPFWVYPNSTDKNILIMSSSNINEAYGGKFYQGPLKYVPGPSEYFDSGVEPSGTQFPKITSPIEFFPGDEIRFGNNENYTYIIKSVVPPENNIVDGIGKIKIVLDSEVPESINKDFFLIRRFTPKASSFILDTQFPYSAESSGSEANGIIYPTFPTDYIKNSGSSIVTDLIDKGVIK